MKLLCALSLLCIVAQAAPDNAALEKLGCKLVVKQGTLTELTADTKAFSSDDFKLIGQCTSLKKLTLSGSTLTDETLPLLAGLTELEDLSTNGSHLTDAGYKHFAAFKNLRSLALWHPSFGFDGFTGSGVAELKALPKLERLTVAGSSAGDTLLAAIGELTQLKEFSTWHTAQTQAGNAHLAKLINLKRLRMGQRLPKWGTAPAPSFDASTIPLIAKLPALETFEIMEAVFTANDLLPLKATTSLKEIKISGTDISEADVAALRAALPTVKIDHKPITAEERESNLTKKLKLLPAAK